MPHRQTHRNGKYLHLDVLVGRAELATARQALDGVQVSQDICSLGTCSLSGLAGQAHNTVNRNTLAPTVLFTLKTCVIKRYTPEWQQAILRRELQSRTISILPQTLCERVNHITVRFNHHSAQLGQGASNCNYS